MSAHERHSCHAYTDTSGASRCLLAAAACVAGFFWALGFRHELLWSVKQRAAESSPLRQAPHARSWHAPIHCPSVKNTQRPSSSPARGSASHGRRSLLSCAAPDSHSHKRMAILDPCTHMHACAQSAWTRRRSSPTSAQSVRPGGRPRPQHRPRQTCKPERAHATGTLRR